MINKDRYFVMTAFRGFEELKRQMTIDHLSADELANMIMDSST